MLPHAIVIPFTPEEPPETLIAHVGFDRSREASLPRDCQCAVIEIGAEHLERQSRLVSRRLLQNDCDGIRLFARCAARHPNAYRFARLLVAKKMR
jgi:hypothetical protein